MKRMDDEEERQFKEGCNEFKKYASIDEYERDLVICLIYSSWHYSEEMAREIVDDESDWVRESFNEKIPANKLCANIGFFAG